MLIVFKKFWQLLKYCNSGKGKALSWSLLAMIFALQLVGIYTGLWLIKWTADFYNALEQRNLSVAICMPPTAKAMADCVRDIAHEFNKCNG